MQHLNLKSLVDWLTITDMLLWWVIAAKLVPGIIRILCVYALFFITLTEVYYLFHIKKAERKGERVRIMVTEIALNIGYIFFV